MEGDRRAPDSFKKTGETTALDTVYRCHTEECGYYCYCTLSDGSICRALRRQEIRATYRPLPEPLIFYAGVGKGKPASGGDVRDLVLNFR